jgi:DNA-directed RNA polymerase sigma subunit (sigma70/sigma32)
MTKPILEVGQTHEEQYAEALATLAKRESAIMRKRFGNRMETSMANARYKVGGARGAAVRNAKRKECKA